MRQLVRVNDRVERKRLYELLCAQDASIPIFSQPWWLDACTGANGWDVLLVERGGEVVASLPLVRKKHLFFVELTTPSMTPKLGPWIKVLSGKSSTTLQREKEYLEELIEQMPAFSVYRQGWDSCRRYWLPFYWAGFQQTTSYTYVIPPAGREALWNNLKENIRREIKKAKQRFNLTVSRDRSVDEFFALNKATFRRQGRGAPDSIEYIRKIDKVCLQKGARQIFIATDPEGKNHAGVYTVSDNKSVYYLMGGGDPELRNSGAASLCLWEAILSASQQGKAFDFEGSMIKDIERYFRGFGAYPIEYFRVTKSNSMAFDIFLYFRPWLKRTYVRLCYFLTIFTNQK